MFIKLKNLDGKENYININKIIYFTKITGSDGSVLFMDNSLELYFKEPPQEVLRLINNEIAEPL